MRSHICSVVGLRVIGALVTSASSQRPRRLTSWFPGRMSPRSRVSHRDGYPRQGAQRTRHSPAQLRRLCVGLREGRRALS